MYAFCETYNSGIGGSDGLLIEQNMPAAIISSWTLCHVIALICILPFCTYSAQIP